MRLLILSRNKHLHSVRRLMIEARRMHIHCDVINPLDCQLVVEGRKTTILVGSTPVPRYDVVLPRIGASITEYGLAVVRQFELHGVRVINSSRAIAESRDKMRCLQILAKAGLPVPKTVLARSTRGLRQIVERVGGFPVVLKVLQGTQGLGVMLLNSAIGVSSVMDTLRGLEQDVIIQQFMAEGAGRDYRAFVVGNRVVAAMMRTAAEGEFRSNIHRGGEGVLVKLPARYERAAVRACQVLGLEVAGVDLMEGRRGPVVIEVNSSPGFEGIERATRLNIGGAIVRHIRTRKPRRRAGGAKTARKKRR